MNSTPALPTAAPSPPPALTARLAWQARSLVALVALGSAAVVFWPHDVAHPKGGRGGPPGTAASDDADPANSGGAFQGGLAQGGFLLDGQGRATTLGPRLAPVTLLHFWATWCPPCIAEAPALARLARDLGPRRDFGMVMVAVADSRDRVGAFMGSGAEMVLFDPKWDVAHRYGTEKLPETYLIVGGRVVDKFIGQTDWDDPGVRQRLETRLRPGSSTGS